MDVRDVVRRRGDVGAELVAIRSRDDVAQRGRRGLETIGNHGPEIPTRTQASAQRGHLGLRLARIQDERPRPTLSRSKLDRGVHEVPAAAAGPQMLRRNRAPPSHRGHRRAVQRVGGSFQPGAPGHGGPERLGGLGTIDDLGGEREHREPGRAVDLAALVGIDERARLLIERQRRTRREQVANAVQHLKRGWCGAVVRERNRAYEPELVAPGPPGADLETEIVVSLLERDLVAERRLVQRSPKRERLRISIGERLPHAVVARRACGSNHRHRPRMGMADEKTILRLVGEERTRRIPAPGSESAAGRHVHPKVGVAREGHEKRGQRVDAIDLVRGLVVEFGERALGPIGGRLEATMRNAHGRDLRIRVVDNGLRMILPL